MARSRAALDRIEHGLVLDAVVKRWAGHLILADRIAQVCNLVNMRMFPPNDMPARPPMTHVGMLATISDDDVPESLNGIVLLARKELKLIHPFQVECNRPFRSV